MQHYLGLEETPFTGGTATSVLALGPRISLTPTDSHQLDTLTGLTSAAGTPAVAMGALVLPIGAGASVVADVNTQLAADADYDIRVDVSGVRTPASSAVGYIVMYATDTSGNEVGIELNQTNIRPFYTTGGSTTYPTATVLADIGNAVFTTLRIRRVSSTWTFFALHAGTLDWVTLATLTSSTLATNAAGLTQKVRLRVTMSLSAGKAVMKSYRNNLPTVTSGNWESAVLDTVDGFRGLGWHEIAGGASSAISVQYRVGSSSGACSAASYSTATNWADVAPSAANRYVQVKCSLTVPNTSTASPEVGPFYVNSTLTQANVRTLRDNLMSAFYLHTYDPTTTGNWQVGFNGETTNNSYWSRVTWSLSDMLDSGNSWTYRGTTLNLRDAFAYGVSQTVSDFAGTDQLNIEGAWFLPPFYRSRSVLLTYVSGGQKTSWDSNINTALGSTPSLTNQMAHSVVDKLAMNALAAADGVFSWTTYADTSGTNPISDEYDVLMGSDYKGNGAWDDYPSSVNERYDLYGSYIATAIADALQINPSYTNAATLSAAAKAHARQYLYMTNDEGGAHYMGRNLMSATWLYAGMTTALVAQSTGTTGLYGYAREMLSRSVWTYLRRSFYPAFGFSTEQMDRRGTNNSPYGQTATLSLVTGYMGKLATITALWSATATDYPGLTAGAHIWPEAGIAMVKGSATNDPNLQLQGGNASVQPSGEDDYSLYAGRIISGRHFQSRGSKFDVANLLNGQPIWGDGTNYIMLTYHSSKATARLGGASAGIWRTGTPSLWLAGQATATGKTQTDVHVAVGRHVLVISKLDPGGATISETYTFTPPLPLAKSDADTLNQTTNSGSHYAYGENGDGVSAFVKALLSTLQGTENASYALGSDSEEPNMRDYHGKAPGVYKTGQSLTGTQYIAADIALSNGAMTPATESSFFSLSQSTDRFNFTDADGGTGFAHVGSGATNATQGSYTLTGTTMLFRGKASAADWFGADGVTAISFSSTSQVTLVSAGNIAVEKTSTSTTKVWTDQGCTITSAAAPAAANKVFAYDVAGSRVDVTGSCTFSGGDVTIPGSLVTTYQFGAAQFDIETFGNSIATVILPSLTAGGQGHVTVLADAAVTLPPLTAAGAGDVGSATATAVGAVTLPPLTVAGAGSVLMRAVAAVILPSIVGTGFGSVLLRGTAAVLLPAISVGGRGTVGDDGTVDTCVLYTDLLTAGGDPLVGAEGVLIVIGMPEHLEGGWVAGGVYKATSDEAGRITWPAIIQGAEVLVRVNAVGRLEEMTVPSTTTQEI